MRSQQSFQAQNRRRQAQNGGGGGVVLEQGRSFICVCVYIHINIYICVFHSLAPLIGGAQTLALFELGEALGGG